MTDLIERLRDGTGTGVLTPVGELCAEAADEIERLRQQLAECERERDEFNTARLALISKCDALWDERHMAQQERDGWKEASQINERMRAELRQERDEYAKDVLRLVETIKYLRGIAERGTGNECPPDITVEQFVLEYVKQLESLREKLAALERRVGRHGGRSETICKPPR